MPQVLSFVLIGFIFLLAAIGAAAAQPTEKTTVQAHIDAAVLFYESDELDAAKDELDAALRIQKKTPVAIHWWGMIDLKSGKPRDAERKFLKAARMDRKLALPHKGLGDAYRVMKNRRMDALESYREALKLDPTYVEAQYSLATLYMAVSTRSIAPLGFLSPLYVSRGRKALERTLDLDPNHPRANHDLGMLYEVGLKNVEKAITYYVKQVEVDPSHTPTIDRLGRSYFKTEKFGEGVVTFNHLIRNHPEMKEAAQPIMAMLQATLEINNGQYKRAQETFDLFIGTLPPEEQTVYYDVTYVASFDDQDYYKTLSVTEQADYRRRFWKQRDSDPTTTENERLVEHYRRVLHARTHFGEAKFPWDRRGEIYIRYGDPDDRQTFTFSVGEKSQSNQGSRRTTGAATFESLSNDIRDAAQSNSIERHAFAPTGNSRVDAIREMNFQQRYQLGVEASTVGISAYRAESWVYVPTNVELFFIDQLNNGVFDFPLMTESRNVREFARQGQFHPARLAAELIRTTPEIYQHDFGGEPLQFFYDVVSFQGEGNRSEIEVAIGLPIYQLGAQSDGRGVETSMEARLILQDDAWFEAAKTTAHFGPFQRPAELGTSGQGVALNTFQLSFSAMAGEYQLAAAVRDAATRKIGIYHKGVDIDSYTSPDLMISDLKLASNITPTIKKRGPFIRNGLEIVPNPTHTYPGNRLVHVYYELYNLKKGDGGLTSFRTDVSVTTVEKKRSAAGRLLSTFGSLINETQQDNHLTVSLEDASDESNISRYTAMDLSESPPGEYIVDITVTDLLDGKEISKSVLFVLSDTIAEGEAPVARMEGGTPTPVVDLGGEVIAAAGTTAEGDLPVVEITDVADSVAVTGQANQSWSDLMRILQSPDYTLAADDSGGTVVEDTTISAFVSNLENTVNKSTIDDRPAALEAYDGMVYIPAGMFLMGSNDTIVDEGPMQSVYCEPFYIDRHEVTNDAYKQFLSATGHSPPRQWKDGMYPSGENKYPVVGVSWYDAQAYAQWVGKRLPTEVEWEKAARGDDGRLYPWGDEFVASWLNVGGDSDGYEQTAPVESFQKGASPYGVQDMAGNVWEWTNAWFQPYKGNPATDPAYGEQYRVIRGGSWINFDGNTRTFNRGKYYPSDTSLLLGFRCVKGAESGLQPMVNTIKGYGYVLIATPGTWADIYVDGERIGQTPQADPLRLRPGTHTLELKNPFYQDYTRTLEVEMDVMQKERADLVRKEF